MFTSFYGIPLFFMILPVTAWSWRALFAVCLVAGTCLAYLWSGQAILWTRPDYNPSFHATLGVAILTMSTIGFGAMVAARGLGLVLQGRGWSRLGVLWADALGVGTVVAALVLPPLYMKQVWKHARRPPPQACLESPLAVRVGKTRFQLPHTRMLSVYFASGRRTDRRALVSPEHHRDLCARTGNGTRQVAAAAISLRFSDVQWDQVSSRGGTWCAKAKLPWERKLCAIKPGEYGQAFPEKLLVFERGAIREGRFSAGAPTYARYRESRQAGAWKDGASVLEGGGKVARYADGFLVARGVRLANGDPLTAYCRDESGRGPRRCAVDHLLKDGLKVHWLFRAREGEASDRLLELDGRVRAVLRSLRAQPSEAD